MSKETIRYNDKELDLTKSKGNEVLGFNFPPKVKFMGTVVYENVGKSPLPFPPPPPLPPRR